MTKPKYKIIADHVRDKVVSKQWLEGDRIPSETELSELFLASRMTARKAVEQLVAEGLLERSPSIGTFVKAPKAQSSLLEIKNIRDEILERGHEHKVVVLSKNSLVPNDKVALELSSWDVKVYKVVILHFENNTPIQLEERYVNASFVPEFLDQDFTKKTSSEY
ncbi:MAG: GntR family transcriptional regulator [Thalassotalea sp.]|nr:GntR family transcriptional regulator [Thalassotalea sp.]